MDYELAVYIMQRSLFDGPYVTGGYPTVLDVDRRSHDGTVPFQVPRRLREEDVFVNNLFVRLQYIEHLGVAYTQYAPRCGANHSCIKE